MIHNYTTGVLQSEGRGREKGKGERGEGERGEGRGGGERGGEGERGGGRGREGRRRRLHVLTGHVSRPTP